MNPDHSAQYTVQLKDSGVSMRTPHFITKIHRYESQARLEGWGEKTEIPWWLNGKESACQCRRHRFNPWVRKIPWRRKWQPTPVFLLGNSPEQRSQGGYSLWGKKSFEVHLAMPPACSRTQWFLTFSAFTSYKQQVLKKTLSIKNIIVPESSHHSGHLTAPRQFMEFQLFPLSLFHCNKMWPCDLSSSQ